MNEAFELLKDPTVRVCEIAWKIGYTQPQHFSRAFKRYTGVSPAKYRKVKVESMQKPK
jgi:AraC-like DNA-binding protein